MKQSQPLLPGFKPRSGSRCRVCGRKLTDPASVSEGIGPVCKADHEADERAFLANMAGWNDEGDGESYPCVKMRDVNRLLGIIERLKVNLNEK